MPNIVDPVGDENLYSQALHDIELMRFDWEVEGMKAAHPAFEGQLRWVGTGLIHESYTSRDQDDVSHAIAEGVIAALVARGWRPPNVS